MMSTILNFSWGVAALAAEAVFPVVRPDQAVSAETRVAPPTGSARPAR